jgi:hypothetical protein
VTFNPQAVATAVNPTPWNSSCTMIGIIDVVAESIPLF